MKIGLVLESDLAKPGGVQEYVRGLYDHLEPAGHRVDILTAGGQGAGTSARSVIRLGKSVDMPIPGTSASTPLIRVNARAITRRLEQGRYDILHFQGPGGTFNSRILKLSRAINIITFHVHHAGIIPGLAGLLWPWERRLNDKYARKIAVSPPAASFAARLCPGSYDVIPNGVDLDRFHPGLPENQEPGDEPVNILFVGRLDRRKGLTYLLSAYKLLNPTPKKRLLIVGDGPEKRSAERYVRRHKLQEVHFLGPVTRNRLPDIYRSADIFCAPATHGESFGIVLLEALATGLPVVAFANPGYRDVLNSPPLCDFLVSPKDIPGLSHKIQTLARDENLRRRLGRAGLEHVRRYSWDRVGARIVKLYEEELGSA